MFGICICLSGTSYCVYHHLLCRSAFCLLIIYLFLLCSVALYFQLFATPPTKIHLQYFFSYSGLDPVFSADSKINGSESHWSMGQAEKHHASQVPYCTRLGEVTSYTNIKAVVCYRPCSSTYSLLLLHPFALGGKCNSVIGLPLLQVESFLPLTPCLTTQGQATEQVWE